MATHHFSTTIVYTRLGSFVQIAAGRIGTVTLPAGGSATVVQGGVTQVGFLIADANGQATFTTTDIPTVIFDFGAGPQTVSSAEAITAGASSAAAAAASQTAAASSASAAAASASSASSAATTAANAAVAAALPTINANAGLRAGQVATPATGVGPVDIGSATVLPGFTGAHDAFPGVCLLLDGRLFAVWRQGAGHTTASGNGVVASAYSSDLGRTWTTPVTIVSQSGQDLRDPSIAVSTDGATLWVTYFKATAGNAAAGAFVRASADKGVTWGTEYRIDGGQPAAAISAPVLQLADGSLLATWYGRAGVETRDSAWVAKSTDAGVTWAAPIRMANGTADARDYQEPVVVRSGTTIKALFRWNNNDSIAVATSTNAGTTWTAPTNVFGGWGRPSSCWMSTGALVCVYRDTSTSTAVTRTSRDGGATWSTQRTVDAATTQMAYSGLVEVGRGQLCTVNALEQSGGGSILSVRYMTDGGAITPLGDYHPSRRLAVAAMSGRDLLAWDDFDRPDNAALGTAPSGQAWAGGGLIGVASGVAKGGSATTQVAWLDVGASDLDIEADLCWTTGSGVGLLFRGVDASNYLYMTTETAGANMRLYKVVAGTPTQLATASATSVTTVDGEYHRFRVSCRGNKILTFVDGVAVSAYVLAAGAETTTFLTPTLVGLRTTVATHYCRRLVVRR